MTFNQWIEALQVGVIGLLFFYIKGQMSEARENRVKLTENVSRIERRLSTLIGFLSGRGVIRGTDMDDSRIAK